VSRSIHLRFESLPSGLASYPRVVLTRRPPLDEVRSPPEFRVHVERVTLEADEIARYAQVCGFDPAAGVPVTYPHVLAAPLHLKIFATEAFPLRPMGLIHVANRIELLGKLEAGARVSVDAAVRAYQASDAGMTFDIESQLTSRGKPLWRETSSFLSRRSERSERPAARPVRPPRAPKDAQLLDKVEVSLRTAWDYARVSFDFNPIHLSDPTARMFGLRGAISHGMWSLARLLASQRASVPSRARIEAQFLSPVPLPAHLVLKEWVDAGERRRAMCDARTGRVHVLASWAATSA